MSASSTPARIRSSTCARLCRSSTMESMPSRWSICDSSRPAGPLPMIATWVRRVAAATIARNEKRVLGPRKGSIAEIGKPILRLMQGVFGEFYPTDPEAKVRSGVKMRKTCSEQNESAVPLIAEVVEAFSHFRVGPRAEIDWVPIRWPPLASIKPLQHRQRDFDCG